jgi:hypothetical protein
MTLPDNEDVGNISLELDCTADLKNSLWDADVGVGAYGFSINLGNLAYSDKNLYVQSRFLGSDAYRLDFTNFAEDFNNSAWSTMLGTQVPDDMMDIFEGLKTAGNRKYNNVVSESISDIRNNFKYSSIKEKKEFELDGKIVKCTGIEVSVEKEYVDSAIDNFIDVWNESYSAYGIDKNEFEEKIEKARIADDLVFDIYLDSKGRIVNMSTPQDIEFTSNLGEGYIEAISFDLNFTGSEYRADVIKGDIYIKADGEICCINVDRNASVDDEQYDENMFFEVTSDSNDDTYTVSFDDTWDKQNRSFDMTLAMFENDEEEYNIYANGNFDDIVTGNAYTLNLKNLKISSQGENQLIISGKYTYEPTDEVVAIPSNSINILEMTESEIQTMIYSIVGNVRSGLY